MILHENMCVYVCVNGSTNSSSFNFPFVFDCTIDIYVKHAILTEAI